MGALMASIKQRADGVWRARYGDDAGREYSAHRKTKREAQALLDERTAELIAGTHLEPAKARATLTERAETRLRGFERHRASTVRQARVHIRVITEDLGHRPLKSVRPSEVRTWVVGLSARGYSPSCVYALHRRLSQLFADAQQDGLVAKNPCSRRTSPAAPKQRAYVATTDQVWALRDALPDYFRPVVLLGAFAGLRVAEIAALRVKDVDFMR